MSLASSDSSVSLLASARRTNGSALKQSTTVDDEGKAIEVLAKLLGGAEPATPEKTTAPLTEEDLDLEFDLAGLSLSELAIETSRDGDYEPYRPQTIQECAPRPSAGSPGAPPRLLTLH